MYDYYKLLGKIVEKYRTQSKFANAMELSERSLSLKLNNKVNFNQNEIKKAIELLDIPETEISDYFFNQKVQRTEL